MDGEGAGPVYFLLHVLKTAGMTVERHILDSLPTPAVWRPLSPRRWRREHGARPQGPANPEQVRVAIGHHLSASLEARFPGREIRRAVLLREPVSFYVSLYNWTMAVRQRRGEPTFGFRLFLKTVSRDMVSKYLLTHWFEIDHRALSFITRRRRYALLNKAFQAVLVRGRLHRLRPSDRDREPAAGNRDGRDGPEHLGVLAALGALEAVVGR